MKLAAVLFLPTLAFAQPAVFSPSLLPITASGRLRWVIESTVLPTNILGGAIGAAIGTGLDSPPELGTHWTGFQKRYTNTMTTSLLSNGIEAGLGAGWGEDPRYLPATPGTSLKGRLLRVGKWTVLARNNDGGMGPAYARFVAIPAAAGISNIWRPESETGLDHFAERTALGFAAHLGGNAWNEFWPQAKRKLLRQPLRDEGIFKGL